MPSNIPWPGFPTDWTTFVDNHEDHIDVMSVLPAPDGQTLQVGLQTDASITWFKQIRVLDDRGTELCSCSTINNSHGPNYVVLPDNWAVLEFVKAKDLGVATGMYRTPSKGDFVGETNGWTLTFRWTKDH